MSDKNKKPLRELVEYEGGGYDGCIWELNYFLRLRPNVDDPWEYHNIYASGSMGNESPDDAFMAELVEENERFTIVDLDDEDQCREFAKPCNASILHGLASHFAEELEKGNPLPMTCDHCGEEFLDPEDVEPTGMSGDGGVHASFKEFTCHECRNLYSCPECGTFFGEDDYEKSMLRNEDGERCVYCADVEARHLGHSVERTRDEMRAAMAARDYDKALELDGIIKARVERVIDVRNEINKVQNDGEELDEEARDGIAAEWLVVA